MSLTGRHFASDTAVQMCLFCYPDFGEKTGCGFSWMKNMWICLQIYYSCFISKIIFWIKSNQIKSLLLSHHHSTSALVSEILMSVLQTVQKNNRQFTYGQTVQKKQQTIYIWTDSAKKQQTVYIWTDSAKKQQTIYIWTDSAKKQQTIYIWTDSAKKTANNLHMDRQCKKNCTGAFTVLQTVQKKQQQQFTYGQTVQKNNSNLHMDSTYLQTVQKTMCKIHIHILSTLSVL